ncbi:MAG: ion channel [Bdellovibrionota bacterium]
MYWQWAPDGIANIGEKSFWNYFFFSVQTAASIGFGHFYPATQSGHILVTIEAFGGLLFNAVITGLVFSRFSRPSARIKFSQKIIWVDYFGKNALMLRLGNARTNRIFEGKAKWVFLRDEKTPEGDYFRKMNNLKLERDETSIFAMSWTLIHVIDEHSPLYGMSFEELHSSNTEMMVSFSGLDQETSQMLSTHGFYAAKDIFKARKFVDMIRLDGETREIDFSKIDLIET